MCSLDGAPPAREAVAGRGYRRLPPSVNTERSIVGEGGLSRGYRQQVRSSMSVTSGHWHRPCWLGRADLADGEMVEEDDRTATYRSMERGWELRV